MIGGRQSSSEVADEAEDTRAHLASTLEQLRTNLQPGNVVEEVVSNARVGAASLADNIADIAKRYPIPSMLIAAGSALAARVFSGRHGPDPARAGRPDPVEPREGYARVSMPRPAMLRNPSSFQPAPGRGGSAVSEDSLDRGDATSGLRQKASDAYDAASSRAVAAARGVTRHLPADGGAVKSRLSNLFDEQPLILGAIGLAVGAAIGAALPITEAEDSLMGSTAHRVRDQASDAARHEVDEMRAAAGQAIDNVRHSAKENLSAVVGKAGGSLDPEARDV